MTISSIQAGKDTITLYFTGTLFSDPVIIQEQPSTVSAASPARYPFIPATPSKDCGELVISRYDGERDRLYSRFSVWSSDGTKKADGVQFVTDFTEDAHCWDYPYMETASKKGTHAHGADAKELGVCHATLNINICTLLSALPAEDNFSHEFGGKTYYIRKQASEDYDTLMRRYYEDKTNVTIIVFAAPRLFGAENNLLLNSILLHPKYDEEGFLSAVNMWDEDGVAYYCAFLDFLCSRYFREDAKYGRATGIILGNEIEAQWMWGNMGETPVDQYVKEYTAALRLTWLTVKKYYSNGRAYISLSNCFNNAGVRELPLKFYRGREIFELLNQYSVQEGNFGWDVAYHPYPESFMNPDFWNDREAIFNFSTPRITFKNIEVLPSYLAQEHLLYKGKPRRIIFSEQGFNSFDKRTEAYGFAGYCLAYKKIEKQPTIDSFIYHAYIDNKLEFGYNLGIRRGSDDHTVLGEAKPVWYAFRDMGTEREADACNKAIEIIGEDIWNELLSPVVQTSKRDTSKDLEFGGANVAEKLI